MAEVVAYTVNHSTVVATGHVLDGEAVAERAGSVRAILRDERGVERAREALSDLVKTDFASATLESVLSTPDSFDEWRVGEALAEEHLSRSTGCVFPWPDSRSTRNPGSSGGGVDLVGFAHGDRVRFVLAEVKTSHQQAWPPSVLTSRTHGLHAQLMGLNVGDKRCEWAIRYLLMNGEGRDWFDDLRAAIATYLADKLDVILYGVLVHVSMPNELDLAAEAKKLDGVVAPPTTIRLYALYLPAELLTALAEAKIVVETAA